MRFSGLKNAMALSSDYREIIASIKNNKTPCEVHGLSESQKAYVSFCLFEDFNNQMLFLTYNDLEAKKVYDDLKMFTDDCFYFPVNEMVFNIDVTSGDIKTKRLNVIKKLIEKEKIIVVASIDSLFYRMPPSNIFKQEIINISEGSSVDIMTLASKLIDCGYERVDVVEGKGQFAQRGGIIDIFSPVEEDPFRIEFFGDEVDTIRIFDVINQRSQRKVSDITVFPAREMIINSMRILEGQDKIKYDFEVKYKQYYKKNPEVAEKLKKRVESNIEKLSNFRYFEGIDSYVTYFYQKTESFLDYFDNPIAVLDESGRILQRIKNAYDEFQETYKSLLERGDVLSGQESYMFEPYEIENRINDEKNIVTLNMLPRVIENFKPKSIANFNSISVNPLSFNNANYFFDGIRDKTQKLYSVVILAGTEGRAERLAKSINDQNIPCLYKEVLDELKPGCVMVTPGSLAMGMEFPDIKLLVMTEKDAYSKKKARKKTFAKKGEKIQSFTDIKAGDFVVHVNHGIGMFKGIKELNIDGIKKDYLVISYQEGDTLYVPVEQLDMVQKYIGSDDNPPKLNKLGGSDWLKTKSKVKESLKEIAEELVKLYAERKTVKGYAFSKDTAWQKQFEDEFPYTETEDQLTAIDEIKKDMEAEKPMDRLLCGDVGYGKTEVAMRAAFKATMDGKQVAVLVPTTILAEQHYNNFKQRFSDFPVNIDMISRFRSREQQRKTIKDISSGNVDIIIGTHRLLQKDIKYKDLGLLIVDEEQRFGVSHKEKIKALKKNVDVLTLTATPIPRTLHMSLIGVRDMSIIETPPEERYPVQTYVMEYNDGIIRDAILRELSRGGQVFFVYNRVETIRDMQIKLSALVPEAKVVIGHGKMNEGELENVILDFIQGDGDILLCTTIIETGIDMPNVNTLIVYDADKLGLSQLYQLRGRVGRSNRLAYSYFTYRKDKVLTEVAEKRLKAIKEFTEFGSGFKIAMRDLEIRGAGNLLGKQQHGHMGAVGYDLYCKLLEESVNELRGEKPEELTDTSIDLTINAYIPNNYIEDEMLKIELYKKIASVETVDDEMDVEDELIDRFGDIPESVQNLIAISYIKSMARKSKISSIKQSGKDIMINFTTNEYMDIEILRKLNQKLNNNISFGSTTKPIIKIKLGNTSSTEIINTLKEFMEEITRLHSE